MVAVARFHISMRESASTTTIPSAMEAMMASDFSFSCATRWYSRAFWRATVAELANAQRLQLVGPPHPAAAVVQGEHAAQVAVGLEVGRAEVRREPGLDERVVGQEAVVGGHVGDGDGRAPGEHLARAGRR